ncbi:hypothetical protein [Cohnella sp. 56]|uniref:hypothetical protein n=1 Tax=Cohnella sp. 56 TaxID=3113722 RepID=UPI0030EAA307
MNLNIPRLLNQKDIIDLIFSNKIVIVPENVEFQRELFLAEYWRSLLYELAIDGEEERVKPVHFRRLKNALNKYLDSIWPELKQNNDVDSPQNVNDVISPVRNCLIQLGDTIRLPNGYYFPAPLRLVKLLGSQYTAIIGGLATEEIQHFLADVRIAGYGRIIENQKISVSIKEDGTWWQDYSNWTGWIPENLEEWIIKQVQLVSSSGSQSVQDFEEFEVYNSSRQLGNRNRYSWINPNLILAQEESGTWLCKTTGSTSYFLGEFKRGRLAKERTITDKETVRWLMLGLLVYHGSSPKAQWNKFYLKVAPPLPRAIENHVLIFSFKKNAFEYYVPEQFQNHIEQLMKSYGYRFPDQKE